MNSNTNSDCITAKLRWKNIGNIIYPKKKHTVTYYIHLKFNPNFISFRVKSGIFGQTAKFGQPLCLFHSSIIGIIFF